VYVPCGSKAAYQSATGWSSFTNIIEENAVTANDINITGSTSVCPGVMASLTASSNIQGLTTYKWYPSTSASATALHTGATYTPAPTSTTTYYVAVSGGIYCENAANDRKAVTVHAQQNGGTVGSNHPVCYGTKPNAFTSTAAASGGTGTPTSGSTVRTIPTGTILLPTQHR
jgi:hypothetical protein